MRLRLLATLSIPTVILLASEKKIQMKDLPAAVQQAVQSQSAGAMVKGFAKETENGATTYEAEMVVNGHGKDVSFDAAGRVIGVEEEVPLDAVPAAAKAAIAKRTAGGTIKKVEKVTEGSATSYEAAYTLGGKNHEMAVYADGSPVKPR